MARQWLVRLSVGLVLLAMTGAVLTRCTGDEPDAETKVLSAEETATATSTSSTSSTSPTIPIDEAADTAAVSPDGGLGWTMSAAPQEATTEIPGREGTEARTWRVDDDAGTEEVLVADIGDLDLDLDAVLDAHARRFDGRTTGLTDLQIAGNPGRTAAMTGRIGQEQAIGYVAIVILGDRMILASTVGAGADPGTLYPRFLQLVGSIRAG